MDINERIAARRRELEGQQKVLDHPLEEPRDIEQPQTKAAPTTPQDAAKAQELADFIAGVPYQRNKRVETVLPDGTVVPKAEFSIDQVTISQWATAAVVLFLAGFSLFNHSGRFWFWIFMLGVHAALTYFECRKVKPPSTVVPGADPQEIDGAPGHIEKTDRSMFVAPVVLLLGSLLEKDLDWLRGPAFLILVCGVVAYYLDRKAVRELEQRG